MSAYAHDARVQLAAHPIAWPLARLSRRLGGVVRAPGLGLVINDAELGHEVLSRSDDFVKNAPGSISASMTEMLGPAALSNMDGEAHRALRGRIADLFSASNARTLLDGCRPMLEQLRADLREERVVDLARWMRVLSGRITFDMMGLHRAASDDEAVALVALGERIASELDLRQPSARKIRRVRADCDQLVEYARAGYESAHTPPSSLIARLRHVGLSFEEARGVLSLIFLAGTLTTAASLPRLVALLVDSGQIALVRERPDSIPGAIAEGLRYLAPVPATMRVAAHRTQLNGRTIERGTRLVILTCNLARDARLFADPDRFDVRRVHGPRARHLWYGAGPHFCLGFAVAQRELQLVLESLLAEPGELHIVRRVAGRGTLLAGYAKLEIRLRSAER